MKIPQTPERARLLEASWEAWRNLRTMADLGAELVGQVPRSEAPLTPTDALRAAHALAKQALEQTGELLHLLGALNAQCDRDDDQEPAG